MSINNENLRNVAQIAADIMEGKIKHPNQQKLDVHEPEKDELTADDFKKLRAMKKEETEQVDEAMQKADVPAYLRKQKGEKPLTVADIKEPRKDSISAKENLAKARNEEVELDEAEKVATSTGMKVYGSSYGNSQRARREQIKKSIDTAKGPKMKDIASIESEKKKKKFTESLETYLEGGIKGLFESMMKKKEVVKEEPDNETFTKEVEENKKKAAGQAKQADVAKAAVKAVQSEEIEVLDADKINGVQIETIEEREMTEPEMKKREEIVKSMKKGMAGFKERYGERAKNVMYATATKQAMKD